MALLDLGYERDSALHAVQSQPTKSMKTTGNCSFESSRFGCRCTENVDRMRTIALRSSWKLGYFSVNQAVIQSSALLHQRPRLIGQGLGMAKVISKKPSRAMFFKKLVISPIFAC